MTNLCFMPHHSPTRVLITHDARWPSKRMASVCFGIGLIMVTGCGAPPPNPELAPTRTPIAAPGAALMDTEWNCIQIGTQLVAPGRSPTLVVSTGGTASGFAGVNRWTGAYTIAGSTLKFGMLAMTKMAGPPERMELEQSYANALAKVTHWSVRAGRLQLSNGTDNVLEFLPAE